MCHASLNLTTFLQRLLNHTVETKIMGKKKNQNSDQPNQALKAGGAVTAGAAAGAAGYAAIGGMGLTVGGTAMAIGVAPFVAAGAVVGLAGYGVYKLFGGK